MLYSIIQIVLFQTLFLLVYDLFLRRETFFNYNRIYLLLTSIFSLVLPFVKLSELRKVTTQETVIRLPEVFIGRRFKHYCKSLFGRSNKRNDHYKLTITNMANSVIHRCGISSTSVCSKNCKTLFYKKQ